MGRKGIAPIMSVFPIGTVMKLTDLSARQIRYYEEQDLVHPERSEGNRRMYSLNDIDMLLGDQRLSFRRIKHGWDQTCIRNGTRRKTRSKKQEAVDRSRRSTNFS